MRRWEKQFALAVADDWMGSTSPISHTGSPNLVGAPLGAMSVTGTAHRAQGRSYTRALQHRAQRKTRKRTWVQAPSLAIAVRVCVPTSAKSR